VVTAAAAINEGAVNPNTTYVDTGSVDVEGTVLRNWDFSVYGQQTMTGVLVHSINTGAVFMERALEAKDPGAFHRYLSAFGFGKPTGIELTGEASGIFRTETDAGYSPVDIATQSFGQSVSVTPLQMITAVAAAINGGKLYKPHLVKEYIAADGTRQTVQPEVVATPITPDASAQVRGMLTEVINSPEVFHPGKPKDYIAGGKSGTANVPVWGSYNDVQIASFVGFAPADAPRILIMVKLDQNADLMTGTQAASPVVAQLIDASLHYLDVPPDKLVAGR
jgi:cell division protein FtsI/penicillin-binding protein 2